MQKIRPYFKNPRILTDRQRERLDDTMTRLGDLGGIVHDLNSNELIGGNQRGDVININECEIRLVEEYDEPDEQGTVALGFAIWKGIPFSYRAVRWTAEQCEEANIVANAGGGDWDVVRLLDEWDRAKLNTYGLEDERIEELIRRMNEEGDGKDGRIQRVDVEPRIPMAVELQKKWETAVGQVWDFPSRTEGIVHRVVCGDSKSPEVVGKAMGALLAEMVWTDPPYGVDLGEKNRYLTSIGKNWRTDDMEGDALEDEDELRELLTLAFDNALVHCLDGGAWYVCAPAGPLYLIFGELLNGRGIWRQTIQWVKDHPTFSPLGVDYHWQAEPIFYGWKPGAGHRYYGGRKQSTVWEINRPVHSPEHPTIKPLELAERAVENSSAEGEVALDLFGGAGTLLLACENLGRCARLVELMPTYTAVILERYQEAYGIEPVLVETMETAVWTPPPMPRVETAV